MATIPRIFKLTTKDNISNVDPVNGQIIAAWDSDDVWYDAPDNGAPDGEPVRRKISGVKVITTLPESPEVPMTDTLYVYIGDSEHRRYLPDGVTPLYDLRIWDGTNWMVVGSNQGDAYVQTDVTDNAFYIVGAASDTSGVVTLLENTGITISVTEHGDTLTADYFDGLASEASHAGVASTATKAENDGNNHTISSYYVHSVESDYTGNESCTLITITDGDGGTTTIKAKDTQYGIFNSTTKGLVDSPTTEHTVTPPLNYKVLTSAGWVNQADIDIGVADKAVGDKNGKDITEYLADVSNGTNDPTAPATQLVFTRGNSNTKTIPLKTYSIFTQSEAGIVPHSTGSNDARKFLNGEASWVTLPEFDGSNSGVVPATGASAAKYLAGDGTWKGAFTSATSSADGTVGLVPAPEDDDVGKVLSNEGWVTNGTGSSQDSDLSTPTYLVGAKSQSTGNAAVITYSDANVRMLYGKLYQADDSNPAVPAQVVDVSSAQTLANKQFTIDGEDYELGTACSYPATDDVYPDYDDEFEGDGSQKEFNLTRDANTITGVSVDDQPVTAYSFVECEDYADSIPYAVGSYCVHEDAQESRNIYRCNTAIPDPESWDQSHWDLVISDIESSDIIVFNTAPASGDAIVISYTSLATGTIPTSDAVSTFVGESLATIVDIANSHVNNEVITAYYDPTHSYSVNDYCMFQNTGDDYAKLYKCIRATSGTPANPVDFNHDPLNPEWSATTIMAEIISRL